MTGHLNIGMPQHFSNTLNGNTICQSKRCESMTGHMSRQCFLNATKLLQKSEMRKNMVMDLIYRGFIYAANYSESHYNPRRSQIKTELRYLFVTTLNR